MFKACRIRWGVQAGAAALCFKLLRGGIYAAAAAFGVPNSISPAAAETIVAAAVAAAEMTAVSPAAA